MPTDHQPPEVKVEEPAIVPPLTERQIEGAERRTSVTASVVHEAIRKDGDEELRRPVSALAWSGLAAGLSMGFFFRGSVLVPALCSGGAVAAFGD